MKYRTIVDVVRALIRRAYGLQETLRRGQLGERDARLAIMEWIVEARFALEEHAPEYLSAFSKQETVSETGTDGWLLLLQRDIDLLSEFRREIGRGGLT